MGTEVSLKVGMEEQNQWQLYLRASVFSLICKKDEGYVTVLCGLPVKPGCAATW